MSLALNRTGIFHAHAIGWGVRKSEGSHAVRIACQFAIEQQLHPAAGNEDGKDLWVDWPEGYIVWADSCVVKKDGNPNETGIKQLVEGIGWDSQLKTVENEPPPKVSCTIEVETNVYDGKTSFRVRWINPYAHIPTGGSVAGATTGKDLDQLAAKHGGQLRAIGGKYQRAMPAAAAGAATPPAGPAVAPAAAATDAPTEFPAETPQDAAGAPQPPPAPPPAPAGAAAAGGPEPAFVDMDDTPF